MIEILERILHAISSIAVLGILYVEMDDVYGISKLRKLSKRRWRKFQKDFMKASKKYFKEVELRKAEIEEMVESA